MTNTFRISLAVAALLLAVPVTASARGPSFPYQPPRQAHSAGDMHQVAKKHHGRHAKRKGCRLTHDGLVCGGSNHGGGNKNRHGNGHVNGHGGNRH